MYKHSRLFSVLSYITWIGWIIALAMRDRNDPLVHRHLNQALILHIANVIAQILRRQHGVLHILGNLIDIIELVLVIVGIIRALRMSDEPLPLVGKFDLVD